jgi:hypothetical protein
VQSPNSDVGRKSTYYSGVCVELGRMAITLRRNCISKSKNECVECYEIVRFRSQRRWNGMIPCSGAPVDIGIVLEF